MVDVWTVSRSKKNGAPKRLSTQKLAPHISKRRTELPAQVEVRVPPGLMAILKDLVGKDLSSFHLPITMNEPVNLLQRACEDLEYMVQPKQPITSSQCICSFLGNTNTFVAFAVELSGPLEGTSRCCNGQQRPGPAFDACSYLRHFALLAN